MLYQLLKLKRIKIAFVVACCAGFAGYSPSSSAEEIKSLQEFLAERACDPGPVDGAWGRKTAGALDLYQLHTGTDVQRP